MQVRVYGVWMSRRSGSHSQSNESMPGAAGHLERDVRFGPDDHGGASVWEGSAPDAPLYIHLIFFLSSQSSRQSAQRQGTTSGADAARGPSNLLDTPVTNAGRRGSGAGLGGAVSITGPYRRLQECVASRVVGGWFSHPLERLSRIHPTSGAGAHYAGVSPWSSYRSEMEEGTQNDGVR